MPIFRRKKNAPKKLSRKEISRRRLIKFKQEVVTDAHKIPLDELYDRLETNPVKGLTTQQAEVILERTGPNTLTPSHKTPACIRYIKTLFHGFSVLLWIGAALCFGASLIAYFTNDEIDKDNLMLGSVLVFLVWVTGTFMFFQERKTSAIMRSFGNMVPPQATVIRNGNLITIYSSDVVVGDLIEIKFGDRIPADIRIIQSSGFKVDNSALTGESEAMTRGTECTNDNILESNNVAFFSTNAIEGTARGIAIACGDNTVMGRIAGLTARLPPSQTPIAKELNYFMKVISIWAIILGLVFGSAAIFLRYTFIEAALFLIGIIVANVPEGMLAAVTVSLTVTGKKMAKKNCLIKNLEAVETLGSISVICSDKTGTLTQNRMTVINLWFNGKTIKADPLRSQTEIRKHQKDEGFKMLLRCAILCNRAEFEEGQSNIAIQRRKVLGDASEAAILKYTEKTAIFGPPNVYKKRNPKLIEIPFNSTTKYQVSVHLMEEGKCLVVMKGAPERILEICSTILLENKTINMTANLRHTCEIACMSFAKKGQRVLGFCDLLLDDRFTGTYPYSTDPLNFPTSNMRFLGFFSLIDPPRPQVTDAVARCKLAGIKVVMVTGDHPVTAKSIAEQVGIITLTSTYESLTYKGKTPIKRNHAIVIPGDTLRQMDNEDLDRVLFAYKEIVFARTSPTQKLQIVESCQRLRSIVAVTGDGVNDAPALKKADIGIAMGITGSEVSKQSSDMILLDDNFASIILGIEEGRKIFDNLKKSIAYILASNIPEITPFLVFVICGIPLPIGVIAVLCIDLLTDMLPAISLAYEKSEADIMVRPPRNPDRDKLVTFRLYLLAYGHIGVIETVAGFFTYFMVMAEHGFFPETLMGIREQWEDDSIDDLKDSFGQEWSYSERKILEHTCYSAFMASVVVTQLADAVICKSRRNSFFHQGMRNHALNISLIIETCIACMLIYCPGMHILKFYPVKLRWWLYSVPFAIFIFIFDEFRKWNIRHYVNGFYYRETYY